jgi:hypothetical protein
MEINITQEAQVIEQLERLVRLYSMYTSGRWLDEIRWQERSPIMRKLPQDVCGMYVAGHIVLMPSLEPDAIFPTYIHELRHRWQAHRHPILYIIGKIIRPLIEDDAVCQEDMARMWLESYRKEQKAEGAE